MGHRPQHVPRHRRVVRLGGELHRDREVVLRHRVFADRPLSQLPATSPLPTLLWHEPSMAAALAERDMATVYRLLQAHGLSQRGIAARTGQSQSEISEVMSGRRIVSYDVLARIADGLGISRGYLGMAYCAPGPCPRPESMVDSPGPAVSYRVAVTTRRRPASRT
jgi:hypothetical protein